MATGQRASGSPTSTPGDDPEAQARLICLQLLTAAPRTRAQLAQAMSRRGVPADAADAVLSRFADAGLIDDAAFARAWVESRHHGRGLSRRSLSAELRRRGIESEEIREAVGTLDPEQEVATARRLARKGYSPGLTFRLIREAMEQEGQDDALGLDLDAEPYLAPEDEESGYSL
jgi:regulatory protein